MRMALFQPDIPPNVGTILRLGACLDVPVDIIEPCGFPLSERSLRRAGMDYIDHAQMRRHKNWDAFISHKNVESRLVLLTTTTKNSYTDFHFDSSDILLMGQESRGVPANIHNSVDAQICIPLMPALRSLNVAIATAMVLGEALRQTNQFPQQVVTRP